MIGNYLKAKWSKGISGKRTDVTTKDIRLLSCFGDGETVKVCPGLRPSSVKMGKFICGECGCGDKPSVFLNGENDEYTKLDHPYLACPRHMPGFSDYTTSESDDDPDERKVQIELLIGEVDPYIVKPTQEEKGCPKCEERRKELQQEVDKKKSEGYDTVSAVEEAKKVIEKKYNMKPQSKEPGGCSSCKKKKKLLEEATREAKKAGFKGDALKKETQKIFQQKMKK
jgi:hypothetical protein